MKAWTSRPCGRTLEATKLNVVFEDVVALVTKRPLSARACLTASVRRARVCASVRRRDVRLVAGEPGWSLEHIVRARAGEARAAWRVARGAGWMESTHCENCAHTRARSSRAIHVQSTRAVTRDSHTQRSVHSRSPNISVTDGVAQVYSLMSSCRGGGFKDSQTLETKISRCARHHVEVHLPKLTVCIQTRSSNHSGVCSDIFGFPSAGHASSCQKRSCLPKPATASARADATNRKSMRAGGGVRPTVRS